MANNTFTITLSTEAISQIEQRAAAAGLTPGQYARDLVEHALTRPSWDEVASRLERQALAAEVERVSGERDRARDLAATLEAENAILTKTLTEVLPELRTAVTELKKFVSARRGGK